MNNTIKYPAILALFLSQSSVFATDFYLSPTGNDTSGDGTSSAPWKSLNKARDHVRTITTLTESVNIILKDGTYELANTLDLTAADSGRNNFTITYKAETTGNAIISGGTKVTGWTDTGSNGVWKATVGATSKSRQLYVDGNQATRARSVDGTGWSRNGSNGLYNSPAAAASWNNIDKVEVVSQYLWKQYRGPIASISGTTATMNPTYWDLAKIGPYAILDGSAVNAAWVENAFELLNLAGEWYLNESTDILYYKPKVGENLTGASAVSVVLPRLEKLINGNNVSNVTFSGLVFRHATWLHPSSPKGYVSIQSGAILDDVNFATIEDAFDGVKEIPGNINFSHSSNLLFENNEFSLLGGNALRLGRASQSNTIFSNTFKNISAAAISIGHLQDHHTTAALTTKNNVVDNNLITKVGTDYLDVSAIKINYSEKSVVANNTIHDVPYTGLSLGWGWGRYDVDSFVFGNDPANKGYNSPTIAKNNLIINNKIYNFANGLGDTGGIYNLGASPGTRILSNLIYDGHPPGAGTHFVNGIYLDNGTRGVQVDSNGIYKVNNHGFFCNGCAAQNTLGTQNALYNTNTGTSANMPAALLTSAGQQASQTTVRTIATIENTLPALLTPVAGAAMTANGILVGKTATATTNSASAVNAIDGSAQTYWDAGTGNTSGSITIDTGSANSSITAVVVAFGKVVNGEEIYIHSGMTYKVETSTDNVTWTIKADHTATATNKKGITAHYFSATARYIRLNIVGSNNQDFGVLRVKAYGSIGTPAPVGTNLATAGTATQSSTAHGGVASRAIDGTTNGAWSANSITHSDLGSESSWTLDLGAVKQLNTVRLWNRTDCCSSRLANFHVFVSDVPFTGTTIAASQAQSGVLDKAHAAVAGTTTDITISRTGRYVRVQLAHASEVISLAEVQVFGTNVQQESNIALMGSATQSSTAAGGVASRAIDGNTNGAWGGNSVTHTNLGSQGYLTVDLGSVKTINSLKLWNRTDCCSNRLTNYHVFVSDVALTGTTVAASQAQTGVTDIHQAGTAGTTTDIAVNRTGRYVRIQLSNTNAADGANVLSLAELQALGY
jgi:hypothetical protein